MWETVAYAMRPAAAKSGNFAKDILAEQAELVPG